MNEGVYSVSHIDASNYKDFIGKTVYVRGSVSLSNLNLTEIPMTFLRVEGSFVCAFNKLTSLKGCPKEVDGYFDCSHNNLNSLEYYPEIVLGTFDCSNNPINDTRFIPSKIGVFKYKNTSNALSIEVERIKKLNVLNRFNKKFI